MLHEVRIKNHTRHTMFISLRGKLSGFGGGGEKWEEK
jgi:hypothetical protein